MGGGGGLWVRVEGIRVGFYTILGTVSPTEEESLEDMSVITRFIFRLSLCTRRRDVEKSQRPILTHSAK